jgi:hypothetical protein
VYVAYIGLGGPGNRVLERSLVTARVLGSDRGFEAWAAACDIAQQWSARFTATCAGAGRAFTSQREAARSSHGDLLDALGSPEVPDQLTEVQFDAGVTFPCSTTPWDS